jgi:hypothetical protein
MAEAADDPEHFLRVFGTHIRDQHAPRAWPFLNATRYRSLRVEIDYVAGCTPSRYALGRLEQIISKYCSKPAGVTVVVDERIERSPPGQGESVEHRCKALGSIHCNLPNTGNELGLYILYFPQAPGTSRLGTAGGALPKERGIANFVVFKKAVDRSARLQFTRAEVEAETLIHEFGHMLGLCYNPSHTVWNNPSHCTHPECAMTGVSLTRAVFGNLFYNPLRLLLGHLPKDYCSACQEDLRCYAACEAGADDSPRKSDPRVGPPDRGGSGVAAGKRHD